MKRVILSNISNENYIDKIIKESIRLFNSENEGHITSKKGSYRISSYEGDFYGYGYLDDVKTTILSDIDSGEIQYDDIKNITYDTVDTVIEYFYDCVSDRTGAHHASEVSDMRERKRELDAKYGFGDSSRLSSEDTSWKDIAHSILECIYQLAEENDITIYKKINENKQVSVKPKARKCTITGYYSGVLMYIATRSNYANGPDYSDYLELRRIVKSNLSYIQEQSGANSLEIKNNITFTY